MILIVKNIAIKDKMLLKKVVEFNTKFYRCSWAHYELAQYGTLKLLPPSFNIDNLKSDYSHMLNMLFGYKPTFDEILSYLKKLEEEINAY